MSAMASDFFGASPLLMLPVLALLIFTTVFAFSRVRAIRLGKRRANAMAQMAIEDDTEAFAVFESKRGRS